MFREAEQFSLSAWLRHLRARPRADADRRPGGVVLRPDPDVDVVLDAVPGAPGSGLRSGERGRRVSVIILLPPVIMAFLLDLGRRGGRCGWSWPEQRYLCLAVALVLALNPLVNELRPIVEWLFPISSTHQDVAGADHVPVAGARDVARGLRPDSRRSARSSRFAGSSCRGWSTQHRTRSAILLSALMFGFLHVLLSLFQQLFNATLLGIVLGLLAVRSRSILPGIVFHFLNNAMAVALGSVVHASWAAGIVPWIYRNPDDGLYHRHGSWRACCSRASCCSRCGSGMPSRPDRLAASVAGPVEPAC